MSTKTLSEDADFAANRAAEIHGYRYEDYYEGYEEGSSRMAEIKDAEIKELREANSNCISLLLHESRMSQKDAEILELKQENNRLFEQLATIATEHPCYQLSKELEIEVSRLRLALENARESLINIHADQCHYYENSCLPTSDEIHQSFNAVKAVTEALNPTQKADIE